MKKDELMLWDWVYHDYQIDHPFHSEMVSEPSQIIGIPDEETIRLSNETIDAGGELDDYDISPIPLTDEILEMNGFRKGIYVGGYYHPLFAFRVFPIKENRVSYFEMVQMYSDEIFYHCHYVHELQHALRLCGLTGLANNFKV